MSQAQDRRTQLFSATMTSKVAKLQRACLRDPVKVWMCVVSGGVVGGAKLWLFVLLLPPRQRLLDDAGAGSFRPLSSNGRDNP